MADLNSKHNLRFLQLNLPWTPSYSEDFRSNPQSHKDFAHAVLHITKATGNLATVSEEWDHKRPAGQRPGTTLEAERATADQGARRPRHLRAARGERAARRHARPRAGSRRPHREQKRNQAVSRDTHPRLGVVCLVVVNERRARARQTRPRRQLQTEVAAIMTIHIRGAM